jgi:tRNA pseudouridine55 synthase
MAKKAKGNRIDGWIALDKPVGVTSADAVNRVKRVLRPQKIGHGGTLDPLASGLLPIALGEATKTVSYVMDDVKTYRFTVRWGIGTETCDAEGEATATSDNRPDEAAIEAVIPRFEGETEQTPPAYSAIKVNGQRAYDIARAGGDPQLEPRPVYLDALRLVACDDRDHATFEAVCGKGYYIRALARDLGAALDTPAHLSALRRTQVGALDEDDMISLDALEDLGHSDALLERIHSVETALDDIPALALTDTEASRLRNGQSVSLLRRSHIDLLRDLENGDVVCAMTGNRAVALARFESGEIRPVRVLNL